MLDAVGALTAFGDTTLPAAVLPQDYVAVLPPLLEAPPSKLDRACSDPPFVEGLEMFQVFWLANNERSTLGNWAFFPKKFIDSTNQPPGQRIFLKNKFNEPNYRYNNIEVVKGCLHLCLFHEGVYRSISLDFNNGFPKLELNYKSDAACSFGISVRYSIGGRETTLPIQGIEFSLNELDSFNDWLEKSNNLLEQTETSVSIFTPLRFPPPIAA